MRNGIAGAVIAAVALCGTAQAIETLEPVKLPDGGLGSDALGFFSLPEVNDEVLVVGSRNDPSRHPQPFVWTFTAGGQFVSAEALSLLPFVEQGNVVGGRAFENGDLVAVGVNVDAASQRHAVLWRKPSGGAWGSPERLSPSATNSDVRMLDGQRNEDVFVAGTATTGGVEHPVLFRIDVTSVTVTELPTPAGAAGAALGFVGGNDLADSVVGGSTVRTDGLREPCIWRREGDAFVHTSVALPKGFSGEISSVTNDDGGTFRFTGALHSPKGLAQGFVLQFGGDETEGTGIRRRAPLPPLPGSAHYSGAPGYDWVFTNSDDFQNEAVLGSSSNARGEVVPTLWIRSPRGRWEPVPVRSLLASDEFFALRTFRRSGPGFVGQVSASPGAAPQAVVFRPTRSHVPDALTITAGRPGGARPLSDLTKLWRGDETPLVVVPRSASEARYANIEISYIVPPQGTTAADLGYGIRAATTAGGAGTLDVKVWNPLTRAFRTVGTLALTGTPQTFTGAFSGDFTEFVDADDRRLRVSLEFTTTSPGKVALLLDQVTVGGFDGAR